MAYRRWTTEISYALKSKNAYKLHVNTVPMSTITNIMIMRSVSFTTYKPAGLARRIINRIS